MKSQDNDESDEFSDGCRKMFSGFNILDNQNTEDSILNDLDLTTFPKGNPNTIVKGLDKDKAVMFAYSSHSNMQT